MLRLQAGQALRQHILVTATATRWPLRSCPRALDPPTPCPTPPRSFHGKGIWGVYPDAILPGVHMVGGWVGMWGRQGSQVGWGSRLAGRLFATSRTPCAASPAPPLAQLRAGARAAAAQVEGGQTSTGSAVAWYRQLVGETGYAALDAEAAAVPPGSEGVVCLDHFQVAPGGGGAGPRSLACDSAGGPICLRGTTGPRKQRAANCRGTQQPDRWPRCRAPADLRPLPAPRRATARRTPTL